MDIKLILIVCIIASVLLIGGVNAAFIPRDDIDLKGTWNLYNAKFINTTTLNVTGQGYINGSVILTNVSMPTIVTKLFNDTLGYVGFNTTAGAVKAVFNDTKNNETIDFRVAILNNTGLVRDWNASNLIINWNTSGFIKNWTVDIYDYSAQYTWTKNMNASEFNLTNVSWGFFVNINTSGFTCNGCIDTNDLDPVFVNKYLNKSGDTTSTTVFNWSLSNMTNISYTYMKYNCLTRNDSDMTCLTKTYDNGTGFVLEMDGVVRLYIER